jgi:hypothetical protein
VIARAIAGIAGRLVLADWCWPTGAGRHNIVFIIASGMAGYSV